MNTPPRLLNSAMSLSSMVAADASSSSFCLPSTSFSPIHCYSSLAELSLSSSSLDATIPFITTTSTLTNNTCNSVNQNNLSGSNNNNNSLLASPVVSRSPRLLDSPTLMNHDLFISPIRHHSNNNNHNLHNHSLLLQTPTHSLSEAPQITTVTTNGLLGNSPSPSPMVVTSTSHSFQPTILQNNKKEKQPKQKKAPSTSSEPTLAPTAPSTNSSVLASIFQQAPPKRPPPPRPKPRPPPKIAPAPGPGHRFSNNPQPPPAKRGKSGKQSSKNAAVPIATPPQSFAPMLISHQQPTTAVQGLLIHMPSATPQQAGPVLLAIPPQPAPQPLLIMAPNQIFETNRSGYVQVPNTFSTNFITTTHPVAPPVVARRNLVVEPAPQPSTNNQPQISTSSLQPKGIVSVPATSVKRIEKVTVTTSRNLADEDIPTKSINLENLNCARSLVVFPPTLPVFATSAKRNFNDLNDMSMSRLSLLASPTSGSQTPSLNGGGSNSGPSSPNSNFLSLSPTLTNDNNPVSLVGIENPPGSIPGMTPAQLAAQMRLADAVHLAPDTTISGINIGTLLDAVRRCRERRTRFGIAQQQVANKLVPIYGEMFRQASICKLENLSIKLEVASRMVAILEPFYDAREEELTRMVTSPGGSEPAAPKPHPRTKFFSHHGQRHSFSDEARDLLRSVFATTPYPDRNTLVEIAEKLNVPRGVVRVWFANRRLEQNKRMKANSLQQSNAPVTLSGASKGPPIYAKPLRAKETKPSAISKIPVERSSTLSSSNNVDDDDDNSDLFFLDDDESSGGLSFFGT